MIPPSNAQYSRFEAAINAYIRAEKALERAIKDRDGERRAELVDTMSKAFIERTNALHELVFENGDAKEKGDVVWELSFSNCAGDAVNKERYTTLEILEEVARDSDHAESRNITILSALFLAGYTFFIMYKDARDEAAHEQEQRWLGRRAAWVQRNNAWQGEWDAREAEWQQFAEEQAFINARVVIFPPPDDVGGA